MKFKSVFSVKSVLRICLIAFISALVPILVLNENTPATPHKSGKCDSLAGYWVMNSKEPELIKEEEFLNNYNQLMFLSANGKATGNFGNSLYFGSWKCLDSRTGEIKISWDVLSDGNADRYQVKDDLTLDGNVVRMNVDGEMSTYDSQLIRYSQDTFGGASVGDCDKVPGDWRWDKNGDIASLESSGRATVTIDGSSIKGTWKCLSTQGEISVDWNVGIFDRLRISEQPVRRSELPLIESNTKRIRMEGYRFSLERGKTRGVDAIKREEN